MIRGATVAVAIALFLWCVFCIWVFLEIQVSLEPTPMEYCIDRYTESQCIYMLDNQEAPDGD